MSLFNSFHNPWTALVLLLMFISYVVILILQVSRNERTLLISVAIGTCIGLIYLLVTSLMEVNTDNESIVNSMYMWLTLAWDVFMLLLLSILPIYIFTMVSTTFTNTRHHQGRRRTLITSFLMLWGMTLLGILIAVLFFPLMYLLKNNMQIHTSTVDSTFIFGGIFPFEKQLGIILKYYGYIVLITIALAIIFAIVMNVLHSNIHHWGEAVITFIEKIKEGVRIYLTWVAKLVPYVILGMLIVLFANYDNAFLSTTEALIIFVFIFFIGLALVWSIEYSVVFTQRKSKDKISNKEFNKLTKEYALNDFAVQSAPVLYPITVNYVKVTGVSEEVANTTPTFTTFMGYSMCGGFYPMLIVLFTLIQDNPLASNSMWMGHNLNILWMMLIISITIPIILLMTLGMTGVPGADVAIILGLLSALGLNQGYFFTIYLIEPMLDKFRGIGNSMGFAAASVLTDKIIKEEKEEEIKKD